MLSKKGQALVEFIVIMPVMIFIMLGIVDFGRILHARYMLENDLDLITDLYKENKVNEINSYSNEHNIEATYTLDGDFIEIIVSKEVEVNTPGLNKVLGNIYTIEVSRSIYEQ